MRRRRIWRGFAIALLIMFAATAAPIVITETACRSAAKDATAEMPSSLPISDPDYRRPEARSYLSYPEWYIVHAYEDFAGVVRQGSESSFDYLASIGGFWSSLCGANRIVTARGGSDLETKVMLYIIGLSFTTEMAVKGLYERTVGQISAWLRGAEPTEEDRFALRLAEDYARFLQQTPWYEYPFWGELKRFWRDTPLAGAHMARKIERRIGLSLEYGAKAGYAVLIGYAAGLAPADLRIKSVVKGLDASDTTAEPRITILRDLGGGATLVETPRYRAFTAILRGLATRGRELVEIAGNRRVLTTALMPARSRLEAGAATEIFAIPLQSRPGWRRVGLDAKVPQLFDLIRALERQGAEFEHVYDY